jgi:hypothetical protein
MNTYVLEIQLFQCIHTGVDQMAVVEAQSRQIQVVEADLGKILSMFLSFVMAWPPLSSIEKS